LDTSDSPHILVIDDRPEDIGALVVALRTEGWRVSVVTSPSQGVRRAQTMVPDLILLDVRMPEMDGLAVGRLFQEMPELRHTPTIYLTAANSVEERLEGLSHGGVDYILKDCHPAELVARVRIQLRLAPRSPVHAAEAAPARSLSADEVILQAAMRLLRRRLAEPLTLDEVAQSVGTYDKRLSAIFREHLGTTVFAWLRQERIEKSRRLLAGTALSMQDIAMEIGFRSACNFTTAFRERLGVTPTQYRQGAHAPAVGDTRKAAGVTGE
jgi:DNA-binding response OmpR family regulator